MLNSDVRAGRTTLGLAAAIVLACGINALLSLVAQALGASAHTIKGLNPASYLTFTVVGVLVGAVGWSLIRARAKNPAPLLNKLVPTVVTLSMLADVPLFFIDGSSPIGPATLMLMHIAVAAVAVPIFRHVLPVE